MDSSVVNVVFSISRSRRRYYLLIGLIPALAAVAYAGGPPAHGSKQSTAVSLQQRLGDGKPFDLSERKRAVDGIKALHAAYVNYFKALARHPAALKTKPST